MPQPFDVMICRNPQYGGEAHPILLNRPIVVTAVRAAPCRPCEVVHALLPKSGGGAFTEEGGEVVERSSFQSKRAFDREQGGRGAKPLSKALKT